MTATRKASTRKTATLKRARQDMPADVREALSKRGLEAAYKERPAYQRNDYLGWIKSAKLESTRDKRLKQMLTELRGGKTYMNMAWPGAKH